MNLASWYCKYEFAICGAGSIPHRYTNILSEDFVAKFEKWVFYDKVDLVENIVLGKNFVHLAVEPACSLACNLDVFVVSSHESFVNDFPELLFQVI